MSSFLVGIDSGSTSVKVSLIDTAGRTLATGSGPSPRSHPSATTAVGGRPGEGDAAPGGLGRVERDPQQHWQAVSAVVRATVARSGLSPRRAIAVGLAAHGDGLHLIDRSGAAVGPAILSSDTRAASIVHGWDRDGTCAGLRQATGQVPFPGAPAALLRWLLDNAPEHLEPARWALAPKDWLRLQMTGQVSTDRTDAAASFADADTHGYSTRSLELTGLTSLAHLLPAMQEPGHSAGPLLPQAAIDLGLPPGIPIAVGLHDVAAALLGTSGLSSAHLNLIVGTFGVNVALRHAPLRSSTVNTRSGPLPGTWTSRRTSRASAANLEWMAGILAPAAWGSTPTDAEVGLAAPSAQNRRRQMGQSSAGPAPALSASPSTQTPVAAREHLAERGRDWRTRQAVQQALASWPRHDPPLYVPFLYGGNSGQPDAASFTGLRSWHDGRDMLRAVIEGITFNHRYDADLIAAQMPVHEVHLSGGVVGNPAWRQLFADVLGRPLSVVVGDPPGPRGAAMTAAVAAELFDLAGAAEALAPIREVVVPGPAAEAMEQRYAAYAAELDRHSASVHVGDPAENAIDA